VELRFEGLQDRNPWLRLVRCRECGQQWYLAIDTVDDDHYFLRLNGDQIRAIVDHGQWPTDYDEFVNVWPDPIDPWRARLSWPWKGLQG
jgi:hypothetical protein